MNSIGSSISDYFLSKTQRAQTRPLKEDEYRNKDNIIYCKNCNTPRQAYIPINDDSVLVSALCKCKAAQRDREEAQWKARQEQDRIARNRHIALPNPLFLEYTFASDQGFNPRAMTIAKNYVEHFETFKKEAQGLLFWGNVGTGKTFLAGCIVNALVDRGYAPLQTNFSRLLSTLTNYHTEDKNGFIDSLNTYDLLVIDDLGIERSTDYTAEMCFHIIDSRYRSGLPMIITTNIPLQEMKNTEDTARRRIFDRILERCHPVSVNEKNIRKALTEAKKKKTTDLLLSTGS